MDRLVALLLISNHFLITCRMGLNTALFCWVLIAQSVVLATKQAPVEADKKIATLDTKPGSWEKFLEEKEQPRKERHISRPMVSFGFQI